jgi:hypothetical protein
MDAGGGSVKASSPRFSEDICKIEEQKEMNAVLVVEFESIYRNCTVVP